MTQPTFTREAGDTVELDAAWRRLHAHRMQQVNPDEDRSHPSNGTRAGDTYTVEFIFSEETGIDVHDPDALAEIRSVMVEADGIPAEVTLFDGEPRRLEYTFTMEQDGAVFDMGSVAEDLLTALDLVSDDDDEGEEYDPNYGNEVAFRPVRPGVAIRIELTRFAPAS